MFIDIPQISLRRFSVIHMIQNRPGENIEELAGRMAIRLQKRTDRIVRRQDGLDDAHEVLINLLQTAHLIQKILLRIGYGRQKSVAGGVLAPNDMRPVFSPQTDALLNKFSSP